MRDIKVSVIVPVYNLEEELERCVTSIRKQSHKNIEIIIVDDGSTDNSRNVICECAKEDKRIITVFKNNGGVSSARLAGIQNASGEYIGFVDGDDEIDSDMYERLLNNALKYDADISHCGYQMVFPDGRTQYFYNTNRIIEQNTIKGIKDLLSGELIEPGLWNKLYKKEIIDQMLSEYNIDFDIKINEDLLMNYYLFSLSSKSIFVDFCPYHYIIRESSASQQTFNFHKIYDPIKVKKYIYDSCTNDYMDEAGRAYLKTCLNVYNSLIESEENLVEDLTRVRNILLENMNFYPLVDNKSKILINILKYAPHCYRHIYLTYAKHFRKRKYR